MAKNPLLKLPSEVLIFDGAMGTMLQSRGLGPGDCPEEWNFSHPEVVQDIHRGYFEAGSEVVETNSFGGSRFKLERFGLGHMVRELNQRAAELAREVCPEGCWVAGSVGPTGELLQPWGNKPLEEVYQAFCEQIAALAAGGVDLICVETMSDLQEAQAAVRAARQVTDLPVVATMTFNLGRRGFYTVMGVDPATAIKGLLETGADAVGANCGNGIEEMIPLIEEMRRETEAWLIAQPNAGTPELVEGKTVFTQGPQEMAKRVPDLLAAGANIIGGCCGTTPEHMAAIVQKVREVRGDRS